jgi:hypothetical protein
MSQAEALAEVSSIIAMVNTVNGVKICAVLCMIRQYVGDVLHYGGQFGTMSGTKAVAGVIQIIIVVSIVNCFNSENLKFWTFQKWNF